MSGCKPQMGALFQDRLADWLSVVTWDSDSVQWGRVTGRQSTGCYKNCIKTCESKWLLEFISPADYHHDKWQICSLIREGAPHRKISNSLTVTKILSWASEGAWHQYWPSVLMWLRLRSWRVAVMSQLRPWGIANQPSSSEDVNTEAEPPWLAAVT
jgi:hypothetical protein